MLTVTQGCLNHPVKLILLPVSTSVPERKIQIAIEFARKNNGHIHLVTWLKGDDEMSSKTRIDAFYKTYKILKECGYPPQYKILSGFDSREVLLQYAYRVNADLILLSSENESFITGLIKKTITNLLQPLSALHVMMLHPNIQS
jgi:K+-sensing histidine kinase KdpD